MATACARAVSMVFGLRSALLAAASAAVLIGLAPASNALPNCTGDGTANTCVIDLTNVATENVDAGAGTDTLQFTGGGALSLNADQIGTGSPARLLNFEAAQVTGGTTLTLTGSTAASPATQSLTWTIDAGSGLLARGGNAIGDNSVMTVNGLFEIGGGGTPADETIGSLAGSGSVSLLNAKTLTAGGNGTSTTFSGVMSGTGNFQKTGGGTMTLTGDNSYTGTTTVAAGILEIGNTFAIDNSSGVTISAAGWLRGTVAYNINANVVNNGSLEGNVTIVGNVTNNGVMRPGNYLTPVGTPPASPPSFGTMAITGNYTSGTTSFFDMEVNLDAAIPGPPANGTTHDFINILGNVTGSNATLVFLREFDAAADAGLATTGNGIQLINVTGTTTAGAFRQVNALNAGALQYLLRYVPNYNVAGDDGYFLQSAVRDELVAHPAILSAGQALIRHCFRDDQRVPDSPKGASYGRAWIGYHQGNSTFGADTGIDMNQDFNCTTGGMDWRAGYGWFGGVSGGFGKSSADLVTPAGTGNLDGDARVIEAYASFTSSSLFVNLSAGYTDMDWTYKGAILGSTTTSTSGFIGSAQAGLALAVDPFAMKLMGTVSYDGTNCGDSCFGFAVTEDTGLVEAKGTIRFDGVTWGGSIRPWAAVSYSDVLSDGVNTVSLNGVSVSADTNHQLLLVDAGLQAYLDENLALFADGGYHESLAKDIAGYRAGIGLKLYW